MISKYTSVDVGMTPIKQTNKIVFVPWSKSFDIKKMIIRLEIFVPFLTETFGHPKVVLG